jgi:hypothetical protein
VTTKREENGLKRTNDETVHPLPLLLQLDSQLLDPPENSAERLISFASIQEGKMLLPCEVGALADDEENRCGKSRSARRKRENGQTNVL